MKFINKIAAVMAATALFASCSNNDDNVITEGTTGDVELYFDNGVNGDALVLGESYPNSNGEDITIDRFNYIISNVVLIKNDGTEYVYPKSESYFIISQEFGFLTVHLENVPAGDYKKVRFGIGVDVTRYQQGQETQQEFWNLAVANMMGTAWAEGYTFVNFEGSFIDASEHGSHSEVPFSLHQNSLDNDNYREVTLTLPTTARVREGEMPNIHIMADANVLLDGEEKILLHDNITGEQAAITGDNLVKAADNSLQMFTVDHVHNGSGHHD